MTAKHRAAVSNKAVAEPVIVSHAVLYVVAIVGECLGRHHLIGSGVWAGLAPTVTTLLLGASAALVRRLVKPVAKLKAEAEALLPEQAVAVIEREVDLALARADEIFTMSST